MQDIFKNTALGTGETKKKPTYMEVFNILTGDDAGFKNYISEHIKTAEDTYEIISLLEKHIESYKGLMGSTIREGSVQASLELKTHLQKIMNLMSDRKKIVAETFDHLPAKTDIQPQIK